MNTNMKCTSAVDMVEYNPCSFYEKGKMMTQNIAKDARDAVSVYLGRKVSQADFARLICVATATVSNWDQSIRVPRGGALILLRLIIQDADYFVPAIIQLHLTSAFHFEVSLELASEFVNKVLKGEKTVLEQKRALMRCVIHILKAKKNAELGTYEVINGMRCRLTRVTPLNVLDE